MKQRTAVTKGQAGAVLAAVKKRYRHYLENLGPDDMPSLVENWQPDGDGRGRWAILWLSGPYEWAYRFTSGGLDEELLHLLADEVGYERAAQFAVPEEPYEEPPGVSVEPYSSSIVSIWPS